MLPIQFYEQNFIIVVKYIISWWQAHLGSHMFYNLDCRQKVYRLHLPLDCLHVTLDILEFGLPGVNYVKLGHVFLLL